MSAPLVALHGFLGTPAAWDPIFARLSGRRGLALPLPGHGPHPTAVPARFDEAADALLARVEAELGPAAFDLVGYSLGARLALAMLARRPDRVRRAVLISVAPGLSEDAARATRRADDEAAAQRLEHEGLATFVEEWEARPLFATQRALPAETQAAQREARSAHTPTGLAAALRRLGLAEMTDYTEALRAHAGRVALLAGEHDEKFRGIARDLAARCPGLVVEIISAVGHNPVLEAPRATAARIEALLTASLTAAPAELAKEHRP